MGIAVTDGARGGTDAAPGPGGTDKITSDCGHCGPGWAMIVPMATTSKKKKGAKAAPKSSQRNWAFPAVIAGVIVLGVIIILIAVVGKDSSPKSDVALGGGGAGDSASVASIEGTAAQGQPAPKLSGKDMYSGREVSLQDMQGKPTLVAVWAHWCPHCQKEMPIIQQVSQEQAADFNFLTVTTAAGQQPAQAQYATPATFMQTQGITIPTLRDDGTKAMQALGVQGFPTLLMVDADGKLVGKASGEMPKDQLLSFMQNPTWTDSQGGG